MTCFNAVYPEQANGLRVHGESPSNVTGDIAGVVTTQTFGLKDGADPGG